MKYVSIILLIVILCYTSLVSAAGKRLAVMQLKGENVSEYVPRLITGYLTTELFRLNIFTIVEQEERDKILKEQGKSLSECTDEKCAIQIGKLLSAELVMFGQVGKLGDTFIINISIIDLETGKHILDENSDCEGEGGLPKAAKELGAKVNLKYGKGTPDKVKDGDKNPLNGNLFVDSEPNGATVFIDNKEQEGTTPLELDVKPGVYVVELRKNGFDDFKKKNVKILANQTKRLDFTLLDLQPYIGKKEKDPTITTVLNVVIPGSGAVYLEGLQWIWLPFFNIALYSSGSIFKLYGEDYELLGISTNQFLIGVGLFMHIGFAVTSPWETNRYNRLVRKANSKSSYKFEFSPYVKDKKEIGAQLEVNF